MRVLVGVRLIRGVARPVLVLMVLVMQVPVRVAHRLMDMLVLVALGEVQPEPQRHGGGRGQEPARHRLPEEQQADGGAHERRQSEVGARACGPQVPHREDIQSQAHAVPHQTYGEGRRDPWSHHHGPA